MVRIHPDPPTQLAGPRSRTNKKEIGRGHSSAGRAPALQAGGHRFDPGWLHQQFKEAAISVARDADWCFFRSIDRLLFNNLDRR